MKIQFQMFVGIPYEVVAQCIANFSPVPCYLGEGDNKEEIGTVQRIWWDEERKECWGEAEVDTKKIEKHQKLRSPPTLQFIGDQRGYKKRSIDDA